MCWGAEFVWCGERDYEAGRIPGFAFRHRTEFPGEGAVEVPMVIGACYMVLRESYERFSGFSPFLRVWGTQEPDISLRAWITGVGTKCVTGAKVGHFSRSKFPTQWVERILNSTRSPWCVPVRRTGGAGDRENAATAFRPSAKVARASRFLPNGVR